MRNKTKTLLKYRMNVFRRHIHHSCVSYAQINSWQSQRVPNYAKIGNNKTTTVAGVPFGVLDHLEPVDEKLTRTHLQVSVS